MSWRDLRYLLRAMDLAETFRQSLLFLACALGGSGAGWFLLTKVLS